MGCLEADCPNPLVQGSEWCIHHHPRRCQHATAAHTGSRRCRNVYGIDDGPYCKMHWGIVKRAPRLALAPPPPPPPPASCPQIVPQPVDNSHTAVVLFPHAHDTTPMVLWADGRFADDEFAVVGRDWELWWDGVLREPPRESGLWLWSGLAEPCGDGGEFVVVASAYRRLATSEMLRLCMIGKV